MGQGGNPLHSIFFLIDFGWPDRGMDYGVGPSGHRRLNEDHHGISSDDGEGVRIPSMVAHSSSESGSDDNRKGKRKKPMVGSRCSVLKL